MERKEFQHDHRGSSLLYKKNSISKDLDGTTTENISRRSLKESLDNDFDGNMAGVERKCNSKESNLLMPPQENNGDEVRKFSSGPSNGWIKSTPEIRKSWHQEILLGFFLRSGESELSSIADSASLSGVVLKRARSPLHPVDRNAIVTEEISPTGFQKSLKKRKIFTPHNSSIFNSDFSYVHQSIIGGVLPEVLLTLSQEILDRKSGQYSFNNVPLKYSRKNFASLTLEQTEQEVMKKFYSSVPMSNLTSSPTSFETHTECSKTDISNTAAVNDGSFLPTSLHMKNHISHMEERVNDLQVNKKEQNNFERYTPFSLEYNECSISAISFWAAQGPHSSILKDTKSSKPDDKSQNKKVESKVSISTDPLINGINTTMTYTPVALTAFHKCVACRKYGHYEIECDSLPVRQKCYEKFRDDKGTQCEMWKYLANETKVQVILKKFLTDEQRQIINRSRDETRKLFGDKNDSVRGERELRREELSKRKRKRKLDEQNFPWIDIQNIGQNFDKGRHEFLSVDISNAGIGNTEEYTTKSVACHICASGFAGDDMLLCDGCDGLFHKQCLDPPLEYVPEGDWFCSTCAQYDSDVSSTVEIEALDSFVVEQRKLNPKLLTTAEARDRSQGVGFDFSEEENVIEDYNNWNTAVTFKESKNFEENSVGFSFATNLSNNDDTELKLGDVCWAKGDFSGENYVGCDIFWPSCIIDNSDPPQFQSRNDDRPLTGNIVKMFGLDGGERIRATDILPFLPNYEELGHNRLVKICRAKATNSSINFEYGDDFKSALNMAVNEIGLANLGWAIRKAREYKNYYSLNASNKEKLNMNYGSTISQDQNGDSEWNNVQETVLDNFIILAKNDSEDDEHELKQTIPIKSQKTKLGNFDSCEINEQSNSRNGSSSLICKERQSISLQTQSQPVDKIIGGIVAFSTYETKTYQNRQNIGMGLAVAYNSEHDKVLVRCIPALSEMCVTTTTGLLPKVLNAKFASGVDNMFMHSCHLGSSFWIRLDSLSLIKACSDICHVEPLLDSLDSTLKEVRIKIKNEKKIEATRREERMVELVGHDGTNMSL